MFQLSGVHFRGLGTLQVLVQAGFEGLVTAIFKVFFGFRGLFRVVGVSKRFL